MNNEFKFVSCKWISRVEDLLFDEEELWFYHIRNHLEYEVTSSTEFFDGSNEDFSTDELRIMRWTWNGHQLLDMNSYPGDNECGTVAFDGQPTLYNSDGDLVFIKDSNVFGFEDRLDFFINLRTSLVNHEAVDSDHNAEISKFLTKEVFAVYDAGAK